MSFVGKFFAEFPGLDCKICPARNKICALAPPHKFPNTLKESNFYMLSIKETVCKDLKVVEIANVLAGPAVGMFFAELGAEVIKIENPATGGDITRNWKLPTENPDSPYSAYFFSVNYRKKHLFLNFENEADQATFKELIFSADILITNLKPASARRMGLEYATVSAINPSLIYGQIDAYADPEDERPAFDAALQAEAGFLSMSGTPDGELTKMPVALIDLLAAHQLKEGILLALLHRGKTGKGAFVRTSLFESAVASLANQATNWLMGGLIPRPMGTAHPNIAPYGDIFTTKDELPLLLAVGTERQFEYLCRALETPDLANEPNFKLNTHRVTHRKALTERLRPIFVRENRAEWLLLLAKAGVPAAAVNNMQAVFEIPSAKNMILEETTADGAASARVKTTAFDLFSNI